MIDFTPLQTDASLKMEAYAKQFSKADIRAALSESVDTLHSLLEGLSDADVVFEPYDPQANDPFAPPDQQNIGWNIAHVVLHATASTEEYAAVGSVLGRGIAFEGRLRYEPDWKTYTTVAQLRERLEESRKIRLAYFDALPQHPHEGVYRVISERYIEIFGQTDWRAAYLLGLMHEVGHYEQIREAARQAKQAQA